MTYRILVVTVLALALVAGAVAAIQAAPTQRKVDIAAQSNRTFRPRDFHADRGESLKVVYSNLDYFGRHDLVFELDGGRVVRTDVIGFPYERTLEFDAPARDGVYVYYSSVGSDRADGLEGKMFVGNAQPTAGPTATRQPSDVPYETLIGDLNNPHGLSVTGPMTVGTGTEDILLLVSEGGTGGPANGEYQPGSGDGRVLEAPVDKPLPYSVLADGFTNSVDPGGGVVGANHAIAWDLAGSATGTARVALVAVAGGPGQSSPGEAAKVLAIDGDGNRTVIADTLAFEREHNPDGEDPESDGIDSNPWRLLPDLDDELIYIVDSGANDILTLDPDTQELSLFAVFEHVSGDQQAVPSGMIWGPRDSGAAIVSLLGGFGQPTGQLRFLRDENGDGDALDPGENELMIDGLPLPSDIVSAPDGSALYIAELGESRLSVLKTERQDVVRLISGTSSQGEYVHPVADKLYGISGLTFAPNGDLLASVHGWPGAEGGVQLQTDRIVSIPFEDIVPPTPTRPPPSATPTLGTATATATATEGTPEPPADGVFLPATLKKGRFE